MDRIYFKQLSEYLEYFPCVAILGARQCGKTTLLSFLDTKWKIFDLEKGQDFDLINNDPDLFFRLNDENVAIDEAQFLPSLFSSLRVAIDKNRKKTGRFIITGSSSPDLVKSISESLAGRIGIIEMSPFTFSEISQSFESNFTKCLLQKDYFKNNYHDFKPKSKDKNIYKYLLQGGYPEPCLKNSEKFHTMWMQNYIKTYLERDLLKLFPGINENRYRAFLQSISNISGNVINYSEIATVLGVSQPTVRDYFDIAHKSFLFRKISSFSKDAVKRIIKHPKGYYSDSGLLCYLLRIRDENSLLTHPKIGNIWEGMVIEEIIRTLKSNSISFDYYYYRTSSGAEVDLVLESDFGLIPIEIKHTKKINKKELRSLSDFINERKCKMGYIISNSENPQMITENIASLPFNYL
ncbi:MAG: ATP-binding protein [Pseudomonadota bacterium]